jgi:hypothetical protein
VVLNKQIRDTIDVSLFVIDPQELLPCSAHVIEQAARATNERLCSDR